MSKAIKLESPLECQSCIILIGPEQMERTGYQVGEFIICGWCNDKLHQKGHIELDGRSSVTSGGATCRWLYPDGSTKLMRVKLTKEGVVATPVEEPKHQMVKQAKA